jgi:hypothetical protein
MEISKPYTEAESVQPNKVAEAVSAPYLIRAATERGTYYRPSAPRYIAGLPASDEVWNVAQVHALVPHIETAVRLAREHFKEIREIKLTYSPDPEIPHWDSIEINLYATGSIDELMQAEDNYRCAFIANVPGEHRFKICLLLWNDVRK